jgi:hypothetical protein
MKRAIWLLRTVFLISIILSFASAPKSKRGSLANLKEAGAKAVTGLRGKDRAMKFDHSHSIYGALLKRYVRNARVDYKGFIASGEEFDAYLRNLGTVSDGDYANWSEEEKRAFWINAYNAFTIQAIIDHYPIKERSLIGLFFPKNSILQIGGVWSKLQFRAAGKMVTLGEIEHEILRKQFNEPRIHFAIVCASLGCPDLTNEAFRAAVINEQLETRAGEFINNREKGCRVDPVKRTVKLSKIFKWFGKDFIGQLGNTDLFKGRGKGERAVLNFVRGYLRNKGERAFLEGNEFTVSYLKYDWALNDLKD